MPEHVMPAFVLDHLGNEIPASVDDPLPRASPYLRTPRAIQHASTVEFINGLRNKIAHDLNFEISDKDERDLASCTPKRLRDIMMTANGRDSGGPLRFNELLRIVLLQIEVIRQNHAFSRLSGRKAHIRLRTVLERTEGAIYRP
jgi:hypothetical protein